MRNILLFFIITFLVFTFGSCSDNTFIDEITPIEQVTSPSNEYNAITQVCLDDSVNNQKTLKEIADSVRKSIEKKIEDGILVRDTCIRKDKLFGRTHTMIYYRKR